MEELKNKGWYLSESGFKCCIAALDLKPSHSQVDDIIKIALNHDLHHIGDNVLPENISSGQCTFINGPIVLQVHKQSNISAPSINQESSSVPRLLKLTLTDGKLNCVAIEYSRLLNINTDVLVPGSKVCLLGSTNIINGVILLEHGKFVFLGGQVARLKEKWDMMKKTFLNRKINGVTFGPPPFLEFDPTKINEIQNLKNGKLSDILVKQRDLQNGAKQAENLMKSGFTSLQTKSEKKLSAEKSVILKGKKTVEKKYTRDLDYKPLDNKLSSVPPTQINNNIQSDKKLQIENDFRTNKEIKGWKDQLQPNNYSKHNPVKAEKKIEISLEDERQNKYKSNNEKYHENHKKESFVCYDAKSNRWTTKSEEKTKCFSDTQKQEGGDTQKGFLINNFMQNIIPKDAETGCQTTFYSHGKDENIHMQSCSDRKDYRNKDQQNTRDSITYTQQNEKIRDYKKYTQSTDFNRDDRNYRQFSENARDDRKQSSGSSRYERKYRQPSDNTQGDKKFSHSRYNTRDDKKFTHSRDNTRDERKYAQPNYNSQDDKKFTQSRDNTLADRKYKHVSDISQDGKKYTQSSDNTRIDKNYKQSRDYAQDDRKKKQSAYNDQNNSNYSQQLDKYKQLSDKTIQDEELYIRPSDNIQNNRKYIQSSGNRKSLDHKKENLPYTNGSLSEKDKKKDFQFNSHKQDLRTSSLKENNKYTQTTENIKNSGSRKLSQKDGEIESLSWSENIHDVKQKTAETEVSKDAESKKKERGGTKRDSSDKNIHPSSYKKDTSDRKFATREQDYIQQKGYMKLKKGTLHKYEDENSQQINYKCDNQSKDYEKVRGEYKQNNSINGSKNMSKDNFKKVPKERFDYKNDVQQVEKKVYPKTSVPASITERVSDLSNLKRVSLEALFASASKKDDHIDSAVINQSVTSLNDELHFSKPGNLAAYQTAIPVSQQQHQMLMEQQAAYFQWLMTQQGFNPQFIQGIYQGSSSYYPLMRQDHNYYDENDAYMGSQYENENNPNLYH
ncbi:tudor domain-containing protein 3 isoform X2 [Hydra vulgaris]|uniref:Tudor domain-containing protein 3 isoform X2 n=1 Tax=Hydra vulgaris TaxID=6087 RepID=A0ABM4BSN2_HYDVU